MLLFEVGSCETSSQWSGTVKGGRGTQGWPHALSHPLQMAARAQRFKLVNKLNNSLFIISFLLILPIFLGNTGILGHRGAKVSRKEKMTGGQAVLHSINIRLTHLTRNIGVASYSRSNITMWSMWSLFRNPFDYCHPFALGGLNLAPKPIDRFTHHTGQTGHCFFCVSFSFFPFPSINPPNEKAAKYRLLWQRESAFGGITSPLQFTHRFSSFFFERIVYPRRIVYHLPIPSETLENWNARNKHVRVAPKEGGQYKCFLHTTLRAITRRWKK